MDKAAGRYLKGLRRALICPREDRERLLEDAGDLLETFAQENPGAFYKDYVSSFGRPEDFAAEMLSNLDPEDVSEARTRRKRALLAAALAVLALLALLAGFWFGRSSRPPAETPLPAGTAGEPSPPPTAEESEAPGPDSAAYVAGLYTDADDIQHPDAVAALTALGVMEGTGDGTFAPNGPVMRAEAAKLITLMMNGGKDLTDPISPDEPTFTDIQGHWAESYVEYCAGLGILSGDGQGDFYPNEPITTLSLAKLCLTALGYNADAYRLSGPDWAVHTDELARLAAPSLYAGLDSISASAPVTRDVAAQLLYNTLQNTPKMVVPIQNPADGSVSWQYQDATREDGSPATLLWRRFQLDLDQIAYH